MGLISRAQSVSPETVTQKKKSGLLQRISVSSSYDAVLSACHEFMGSVGAERGGILYASEAERMSLILSSGFDFTTTRRFIPKTTQLDAYTNVGDWISISGTSLEDWKSLFSYHELNSLQSLSIRKIPLEDDVPCFFVISKSLLDIKRKDSNFQAGERQFLDLCAVLRNNGPVLRALSPIESVNKSQDAMKSHAESALMAKKNAAFVTVSCKNLVEDEIDFQTDESIQAIYGAIAHQIARLAGSSNIIYAAPSGRIRIVLFTSLPTDVSFYVNQLMKPLERLFGLERVKLLQVTDSGTSRSLPAIMDFLAGEI